jgi:hypothetical protein
MAAGLMALLVTLATGAAQAQVVVSTPAAPDDMDVETERSLVSG